MVDDVSERHSLRRAATLTALVGAAHALLFLASFLLVSELPTATASDDEIVRFYSSDGRRVATLAGLYLMPFAGIAFVWFIVALRMWISGAIRRENVLLSNVQLVSGIVFVALFFAATGSFAVVAASAEFADTEIDPGFARQFPSFGSTLLFVFAFRMAAMFVFTTSSIGRSAGILPRWFVLVFPIWLLVLAALLLRRARAIPADARVPARRARPNLFARWWPGA